MHADMNTTLFKAIVKRNQDSFVDWSKWYSNAMRENCSEGRFMKCFKLNVITK